MNQQHPCFPESHQVRGRLIDCRSQETERESAGKGLGAAGTQVSRTPRHCAGLFLIPVNLLLRDPARRRQQSPPEQKQARAFKGSLNPKKPIGHARPKGSAAPIPP